MSRSNSLNDFNMEKHFLFTRPMKIDEFKAQNFPDLEDANWREKSRQLQARRWRKIKNQEI